MVAGVDVGALGWLPDGGVLFAGGGRTGWSACEAPVDRAGGGDICGSLAQLFVGASRVRPGSMLFQRGIDVSYETGPTKLLQSSVGSRP